MSTATAARSRAPKTGRPEEHRSRSTNNTVHIYFLLDRTGSMGAIRDDVIGGFNTYLSEQQAMEGPCKFTLVQFDSQGPFEIVANGQPLAEIRPLSTDTFIPRAMTPLYDAIGRLITHIETTTHSGEQILVVIFTDGQENCSREFMRGTIFKLMAEKQGQGWVFAYLGANQDAYEEGAKIGTYQGSTQSYVADSYGVAAAYSSTSDSTTALRSAAYAGAPVDNTKFFVNKDAEEDKDSRKQ